MAAHSSIFLRKAIMDPCVLSLGEKTASRVTECDNMSAAMLRWIILHRENAPIFINQQHSHYVVF